MAKVFISYRRADSAPYTGRIYDRLVAKFGRKNVFKDVDDIPAGVNFATYIQDSLRQCAVELVVIGRDWLESRFSSGERRLDDPADFVRIEIETAFSLGLTVIPILLDGATMPAQSQLPESLRPLALINGLVVRNDPDFARDIERVITALERTFTTRPSSSAFGRRASAPAPPAGTGGSATTQATSGQATVKERSTPPTKATSSSLGRAWRPLVAGLAALLVVTSFGALFSRGILHGITFGNTSATRTLTQGSATTTGTTTTGTTTTGKLAFPYSAPAPGPGCDKGLANWGTGSIFTTPTISCLTNPVRLRLQSDDRKVAAVFMSAASGSYGNLPTTYAVSVQISGIGTGTFSELWIETTPADNFSAGAAGLDSFSLQISSAGQYTFLGGPTQCSTYHGVQGSVDVSSSVTVTIIVGNADVSGKVNGSIVGSCADSTMSSNPFLRAILGEGGTPGQADFSNFSIT